MRAKEYIKNILIAIDQFGNTLLGGNPDETISSRLYRASSEHRCARIGCFIVDAVFLCVGDKDHCKTSYENECRCPVHETK